MITFLCMIPFCLLTAVYYDRGRVGDGMKYVSTAVSGPPAPQALE